MLICDNVAGHAFLVACVIFSVIGSIIALSYIHSDLVIKTADEGLAVTGIIEVAAIETRLTGEDYPLFTVKK